jgi:hypothetical protein
MKNKIACLGAWNGQRWWKVERVGTFRNRKSTLGFVGSSLGAHMNIQEPEVNTRIRHFRPGCHMDPEELDVNTRIRHFRSWRAPLENQQVEVQARICNFRSGLAHTWSFRSLKLAQSLHKCLSRSMGKGKMIVEFFSALMLFRVWKI